MGNIRRWYVYLVSAVTLQAVTWAIISLIRDLAIVSASTATLAFQISVIVVALPLYLGHWLSAQRAAAADPEQLITAPRPLYLYAMMAAFLAPLANSAYQFIRALLHMAFGLDQVGALARSSLSPARTLWVELIAIVVLALFWTYHWRIGREDERRQPASDAVAAIRQLYIFIFTAAGLILFVVGAVNVLRWLFLLLFPEGVLSVTRRYLSGQIAAIIVGLPLWLMFWRLAQGLFYGGDSRERVSGVRKSYLYLAVFSAVMAVVATLTMVLSDILVRLVGGSPSGGDIRRAAAIVIVGGVFWAYHTTTLRRDAEAAVGSEQKLVIRRIYQYLTAGIGLTAVLTGLIGDLNAAFVALGSPTGLILSLREQIATFTAVQIAGFPVWLVNWSWLQGAAHPDSAGSREERASAVRRIYLTIFLFAATMGILGSAIYILSQLIELLLGARTSRLLFRDLGQALAYAVIAGGVLLYHGSILRKEARQARQESAARFRPLRVAVIDHGDGALGRALLERFRQKFPSLQLQPIALSPAARRVMDGNFEQPPAEQSLAEAEVIVGPWNMVVPGAAGGLVTDTIAHTIGDSPARKVLMPVPAEGWEWTGVDDWKADDIVKEVAAVVERMAVGDAAQARRRLGAVSIVLIVLGVLFLLTFVIPAILFFVAILTGTA